MGAFHPCVIGLSSLFEGVIIPSRLLVPISMEYLPRNYGGFFFPWLTLLFGAEPPPCSFPLSVILTRSPFPFGSHDLGLVDTSVP